MKAKTINSSPFTIHHSPQPKVADITLIILLILAGVSLSFVFNGGILDKSQQVVNEYENASQKEQEILDKIDKYLENELGDIKDDSEEEQYNGEANAPKITEGMIPVKYNETSGKWVITNVNDKEWYDYNNKKWANVMLSDGKYKTSNLGEYTTDGTTEVEIADLGSMFVWIPRYAYKIESGYHSSEAGTIDVKFLKGATNEVEEGVNIVEYNEETTSSYTKFPDGYVVHPAFTNKVEVGGWDKEIEGIWVAKFEAGYPMEGSIDNTGKTSSNMYYPVFKGQRYSYNNVIIGDAYKIGREIGNNGNPYEITGSSNSHMIKNSEWGAVAYLTQSKYGKNSEIYPNNVLVMSNDSRDTITGYSANSTNSEQIIINNSTNFTEKIGTSTVWYKEAGYEASTTGNITGVYDMSGGIWDFTSNLILSGNANIESFGGDMAKENNSTKYITLYPIGNSTAENTDIDLSYLAWGKMYGYAIWETSLKTEGGFAWYGDRSNEQSSVTSGKSPFIVRGGSWNMTTQTGVYCFANNTGVNVEHATFRVSFIVE